MTNPPTEDPAEVAVETVRSALEFAQTEPYGDLAMGAHRAAVLAVAALRDAGLLSGMEE